MPPSAGQKSMSSMEKQYRYKERGVGPESAKENRSQSPGPNPPVPCVHTIFPCFTQSSTTEAAGSSKTLMLNVDGYLPDYMTSHPRRQQHSKSLPENLKSHRDFYCLHDSMTLINKQLCHEQCLPLLFKLESAVMGSDKWPYKPNTVQ